MSAATLLLAVAALPAREVRVLMGTLAELQVWNAPDPASALDAAFDELRAVDESMSLWQESALVQLNRDGRIAAPAALLLVVRTAREIAAATGGAFDPTVEPLLRARGLYSGTPRELEDAERDALLLHVGFEGIRVEGDVISLRPGTALDLGGIAKGYAADRALDALRKAGASAGLVDLGSSSLGAFGTPLTVEIPGPGGPLGSFRVEHGAVASSGNAERPGHILDPRTGRPASGVRLATVVAASGIEADALSTALYVLGVDGLPLLARRGAEGLVVLETGAALAVRTTPGFAERHALRLAPGAR